MSAFVNFCQSSECITLRDENDPSGRRATTYCSPPDDSSSEFEQTEADDDEHHVKFFKWNRFTDRLEPIARSSQLNGQNLKILIDGFLSSAESWKLPLHRNLIGALRYASPNSDLMIVDWAVEASVHGGAWQRFWELDKFYTESVQNVKKVGAAAAKFLENHSTIDLQSAHCIGYSLGAHVCGFLGKHLTKGRLGRISGLDPAGPGFDTQFASDRLDESDALFVDVIHASTRMGFLRAIGHVDFYINDPTRPQPGCERFETISPVIQMRRRRRRELGKTIDGWKNFLSKFVRGIDFSHNEDVVSYFTGSPYGLSNYDKEGIGQVILDSITRYSNQKINEANTATCSHGVAVDAYTSSCLPTCRMEFCACLSYISTQHEAYFLRQLEAGNCTREFCSDWHNKFLFGYWARPAPKDSQRYLFGSEKCEPWPISGTADDGNLHF